jgi:hypothetical protein
VCKVALRSDNSGLLVSVSRGISQATDKAAAAMKLRDDINDSRRRFVAESALKAADTSNNQGGLLPYQSQFITFAIANRVLQFGSFKLKSGRMSPYFFNAGLFCSGESLNALSRC